MIIHRIFSNFLIILLLPMFLLSCSDPETPEQIVTDFVAAIEEAFEQRNRSALKHLISDQYIDVSKRTKKDILTISNGYLLRNKSIHSFTMIDSVSHHEASTISAHVLTALASQPITDLSILPSLKGDMYWFDITISRVGDSWQLIQASWQQAMLEDFL